MTDGVRIPETTSPIQLVRHRVIYESHVVAIGMLQRDGVYQSSDGKRKRRLWERLTASASACRRIRAPRRAEPFLGEAALPPL